MLTGYGQFPEAPSLRDKIGKDLRLDFQGLQKLHGVRWKIGEDLDNWSNRFTKKMERAEAGPGGAKKNVNSLRNLYHLVHKSASSRLY